MDFDWKTFLTAFSVLFLAELGDKTQLAAITLAAQSKAPFAVFFGSVLALALVAAIGVGLGSLLGNYLPEKIIHNVAAVAFIVIGVLMLWGKM